MHGDVSELRIYQVKYELDRVTFGLSTKVTLLTNDHALFQKYFKKNPLPNLFALHLLL